MEYELRRNRITAGHIDDCIEAWLSGVVPLRRRFGFTFGGAWIVEATHELLWILAYDGPDGFDDADRRYYASTERSVLDPDPAQWFETTRSERLRWILDPG
ncbi:MAG TPA: hypothetical protein VK549_09465 [Acidimicrobiia bacterium]|nr:hypothetical protein [Acidimicrobiia bacterium]